MGVTLKGAEVREYSDAKGNTIVGNPATNPAAKVEFNGSNCRVVFGEKVTLHGAISFRRDNSTVFIGTRTNFRGLMSLGLGCSVTIGDDVYCGLDLQMTTAEGTSITLGSDLLIANHVRIRADDSHPIYDGVTGKRINPSASVTVEDHVWLGQEVFLMPGAHVHTGAVVGARSMVTKSRPVPANCLAIGTPAKVQRRKINWVRKHLQLNWEIPETVPSIFEPDELVSEPASNRMTRALAGLFR